MTDTKLLRDQISLAANMEAYHQIVEENAAAYPAWSRKINSLIQDAGLSEQQIATDCGVTRKTVATWRKKIPAKRLSVVALGISLGLETASINYLLDRYAHFPQLYVKNPEDAICIYLANLGKSAVDAPSPFLRFAEYKAWYLQAAAQALEESKPARGATPTGTCTRFLEQELSVIQDKAAFQQFCLTHMGDLRGCYDKLLAYIQEHLEPYGLSLATIDGDPVYGRFYRHLLDIRKGRETPKREYLLALGLTLSMPPAEIDQMLALARMEGLCPKDQLEGAILFALEDLLLCYPSIANATSTAQFYALLRDVAGTELTGPGYEELRPFFSRTPGDDPELEADTLASYVKRRLEESWLGGTLRHSPLYKLI